MPNTYFKYSSAERKVITSKADKIPEKMQQQLDYIANAMYDTGFTPDVELSDHGRHPKLDIKYIYEGKEQGIYFHVDLDALNADDTIVTLVLPIQPYWSIMYYSAHSSRCSLLEKVSQRYFISLVVEPTYVNCIPTFKSRRCKLPTISLLKGLDLTKIKWTSFKNDTPNTLATEEFLKFFGRNTKEMLPELEKIKIKGTIVDRDCELLSKLISECMFTGKVITIILGRRNFYSPYLNSSDRDFSERITDDGALKLINAFNKEDTMVSLNLRSRKISSNIQDKLKELNELNKRTLKLMTSFVKENIGCKKEEFEEIVDKEFLQIIKENILEVFWKLKNNPKIHKMISEKLNPAIKDSTAYAQEDAQTAVKTVLTKASTAMFNKYILPDIKDIKDLKDLPSKVESLVRFIKLPAELQEHILQLAGSKIFSSGFGRKELQEIDDLKEICILLDKIKTAAADCVQSNELLLSQSRSKFKSLPPELQKCVKDNIKSLVFDTKISGTDAESSYNLLRSTVNEVEDLLSKLQEQTIECSAEATISDNVLAYDVIIL